MYDETFGTLDDSLFEAMFGKAVNDNFKQFLNDIPSEEELENTVTISELHEQRMKRLFTNSVWQERILTVTKWTRKVAAVFTAVFTVSFGLLILTDDVQAAVYRTVIHWIEDITQFTTHEGHKERDAMEPKYIPDGFFEKARTKAEDLLSTIYMDNTGSIIVFNAISNSGKVSVRNVNREYERMHVGEIECHAFYAQGEEEQNSIVWKVRGYRYYIIVYFAISEVMEIVLSME